MARIYVARATGIGSFERHVVLKIILPERANDATSVQMFLDEARLSACLNHQNVAQVFEVGEEGGIHYLAMEYVHGQDLRALLSRAGSQGTRVPFELALTIVAGAAAGLNHAHERRGADGQPMGIVHRDVSPSNIMIGYDGSVKLLDFGIAKATLRSVETQSGIIKGKFAYMAPEQCRGREVDRRTDVFSLGIILYEVTTQHRCFRADSDFDSMHRIVTGDIVRPTRLIQSYPQALEAIVMKALAVDPVQRYQSAGQLLEALESFAMAQRMSLSTMALGRFMRDMFGDIEEPWLASGRLSQPAVPNEQTVSNTAGSQSAAAVRPPDPMGPTALAMEPIDPLSAPQSGAAHPGGAGAFDPFSERAGYGEPPLHLPSGLAVDVASEPVRSGYGLEDALADTVRPSVLPVAAPYHRPVAPARGLAGGSRPIPPPFGNQPSGSAPAHPMPAFATPGSGSGPAHPVPAFATPGSGAGPAHPAPPLAESAPRGPQDASIGTGPMARVPLPGVAPMPGNPQDASLGTGPMVRVPLPGVAPMLRNPQDASSGTGPVVRVPLPGVAPVSGRQAEPGGGTGPVHRMAAGVGVGSQPIVRTKPGYTGAPGAATARPLHTEPPLEPSASGVLVVPGVTDSQYRIAPSRRWLYIGLGMALVGVIAVLVISIFGGNPSEPVTTVHVAPTAGPSEPAALAPLTQEAAKPSEPHPEAAKPTEAARPTEAAEPPAEAARSITIHVGSTPPGADVLLAGTPIGTTPLEIHVGRQASFARLTVHRAHYLDVTTQVDLSTDYSNDVKLTAITDEPTRPGHIERPPQHEVKHTVAAPPHPANPPPAPARRCQPPERFDPFDTTCDGKPCPACPM